MDSDDFRKQALEHQKKVIEEHGGLGQQSRIESDNEPRIKFLTSAIMDIAM